MWEIMVYKQEQARECESLQQLMIREIAFWLQDLLYVQITH